MPEPSVQPRPETLALVRRASEHEARGAWSEAIAAWASAAAAHPSFLPAQLGLAQARIRAGRPADALPELRRISTEAPNLPAVWLALAVANSMLNRHDEAIAAAARAVAAAPQVAATHLGLGDVHRRAGRATDASAAYAKAVELAPNDAEALNKLATMRRALRDREGAEALLRRALEVAPHHPYARVNAGTLALALGRRDEGRSRLAAALDDPRLPKDARREAIDALAMLDEAEALAGPIDRALATNTPAPIESALRARRRDEAPDERLVELFARVVDRYAARPGDDARFARGAPSSPAWGAIEAHHAFLVERTQDAISATVDLVARGAHPGTPLLADIDAYAQAVRPAAAWRFDDGDPIALEAALRWTHARLVSHRGDVGPGQLRVANYLSVAFPGIVRSDPRRAQATIDAVVLRLAPRLPAGPARIAFLRFALVLMQPFADGNTRAACFLQNRLLERAGFFPSLRPPDDGRMLLEAVRDTADLEPLIASLAAGSHEASALDRAYR